METAIYVFSGFLGSGKTLSIQETILKTFTYTLLKEEDLV